MAVFPPKVKKKPASTKSNITLITRFTHISICTTSYLQADTKVKYIRMSNHASMKLGNSPKSW